MCGVGGGVLNLEIGTQVLQNESRIGQKVSNMYGVVERF